jgi:peptide deformylase
MKLKIQTGKDNPILRTKSKEIKSVTKKTLKLIKDMIETMIDANGVGLAAPQVGINERLVIITLDNKNILPLINPKILSFSKEKCIEEEGCLSLPKEYARIERSVEITLEFTNVNGKKSTIKFFDFEARELQHEIDHLDGILFTDYLNTVNFNNVEINSDKTQK